MVNEAKTEVIVRKILYENKQRLDEEGKETVIIEEKKSDIPRIQKLLLNASKRGKRAGMPEFIISFPSRNLIIVIECKAELKHHKSGSLDRYADFAVDGALLYSSYLAKDFDVIAIGVSGETQHELLIDTFMQICGEGKARDLRINKIYGFPDYISILKKDAKKEESDYTRLMDYSLVLNKNLRDNFEFEENQRPQIVSGILLALEDEGFLSSYPKKKTPLEVANLIITTIKERLERDNVKGVKQDTIVQTYGFIKTNTKIINATNGDGTPNTYLKDLIQEIERSVKPFLDNYKEYDVIGKFYNEFLRYANGDGGLGIVLTPKHITELFVDLAQVNENSVIIDNCCGTAGFLISAMKMMEDKANGDKKKLRHIHESQLLGIEDNPKMFCLACSNMMLRGDGKSNINQQDCFQVNKEEIKKFKPTIGFLNPPYSKVNGHKELAFVENCLELIEPHGTCIAIVPQSCAMNTKKGNLDVKRRLLEKHTLKAVMSMPNSLFEDSDISTYTCILVFEAHKKHDPSIKTWFGYWKNDGFVKIRPHGRRDYYKVYQEKIKKYWLESYFSRKEIPGFSVLRGINAVDEWLVEPYIETRFESVKDEDFISTMRDYATFLFSTNLAGFVSRERVSGAKLELDFSKWGKVRLGWDEKKCPSGLFKVRGSKTTAKRTLDDEHNTAGKRKYPYVTTQASNNGIRGFYDIFTEKGNIMTIDSATVGYCSYQPLDFSAGDHVEKLIPKFDLNVYRGLFLATLINMEQYRYCFGRKLNQPRINNTIIKLPFKDGRIDWDFIERYMKGLPYSKNIEIVLK